MTALSILVSSIFYFLNSSAVNPAFQAALQEDITVSYEKTIDQCYSFYDKNNAEIIIHKKSGILFPRIWIVEDIICMDAGSIDKDLSADFAKITKFHKRSFKRLVITSVGGDAEAAMQIGTIIRDRGISVFPWGYCVSSCANYIFLAAKEKYYGEYNGAGPVIAFHGKPMAEKPNAVTEMHAAFFANLKLTDTMTFRLPCNLEHDEEFHKVQDKVGRREILWMFPPEELERGFGVTGLKYDPDFKLKRTEGSWRFPGYERLPINNMFFGVTSCATQGQPPTTLAGP